MIPFSAWLPDRAELDTAASADVSNVIPAMDGFRPMPGFVEETNAATAMPIGVISVRAQDGTPATFYGDTTKLYKLNADGVTWNDASRTAGGAYTTVAEGAWSFSQFGNDIMASNGVDATQVFLLGSSTNFAPLAGSPPVGYFTGVVRGFAVIAKLATNFNAVAWSGIEDNHTWAASPVTLADQQVFPDGGNVTGFVGGEFGIVFQESAIQRMVFEGPPTAFRFDKISQNLGCRLERSIASYGDMIFFLGDDGFYMIGGGQQLVPIGEEKVDRWVETNLDLGNKHLVRSAIDPLRSLYLMTVPISTDLNGYPETTIAYHWPSQQWTKLNIGLTGLYVSQGTKFYTVDSVPGTVDSYSITVDSDFWKGKSKPTLAGFSSAMKSGSFTGGAMEATAETKDFQLTKGRKTLLRGVRPIIEGVDTSMAVTIKGRTDMHRPYNDYGPYEVNDIGYCPVRVNERYHRAKITIPANENWTFIRGIDDLKFSKMGYR